MRTYMGPSCEAVADSEWLRLGIIARAVWIRNRW